MHPVAILIGLLMFVVYASSDHIVEAYGSCYGFVCNEYPFFLFSPCGLLSICIVLRAFIEHYVDIYYK